MKSLNSCIPLIAQQTDKLLVPTRYWALYLLSNETSLLLHLLTGAIDIVTDEEASILQKMFKDRTTINLPLDFKVALEKRGYLSNPDSEQVFINNLAERHQRQVKQKPIEFFICPTFSCPLGCSYCFEEKSIREAKTHIITPRQIDSIFSTIERIKKIQERPLKEIVLFGGEPLLPITKVAVRKILQYAFQKKYKVSVCTSGIFGREFTPLFHEFSDIISVVRVTIDGPKEHHDTLRTFPNEFDKAVEGIDALLSIGIPVMIRTNVGKKNIKILPEIADYFVERGWTKHKHFDAIITGIKDRACIGDKEQVLREDELAVRLLEMRTNYKTTRRLRPLNVFMSLKHLATNLGHLEGIVKLKHAVAPLETIKFHGCGAIDGALYVFGPDSRIYVCTEAIGKPALSVGRYHPAFELNLKSIGKWQNWHKYTIPECRECKYLLICGGTCTMTSMMQFGSGEKPICPPISQTIEGYISALADLIVLT